MRPAAVRAYAADAIGDCSADRITRVRRLAPGERHAVFQVSYEVPGEGGKEVVVRVSLASDADERARAQREAVVLAAVQGVAGPLLHDFRVESPWFDGPVMCLQLIRGQQRDLARASGTDAERLGAVVGRLHRVPTDVLAAWFPDAASEAAYRAARLAQVVADLPSVRDPLPAPTQRRIHDAVQWVDDSSTDPLAADDGLVLLHGDVASGNVLWGPDPVLIDWEYARIGDPADELAYTFSQCDLTAVQREAFWRGYRSRASSDGAVARIADRVGWWEPVTLLGSVLWWIERWSRRVDADAAGATDPAASKPADHYLAQAMRRLDRFEAVTGERGA